MTICLKNLQDLTSISTFIDKIIQTNLTFAKTIWKYDHKEFRLPLNFQTGHSFYQAFITQGAIK